MIKQTKNDVIMIMMVQKWSELAHEVRSVLKEYPKLRLTQGRKVNRISLKLIALLFFVLGKIKQEY